MERKWVPGATGDGPGFDAQTLPEPWPMASGAHVLHPLSLVEIAEAPAHLFLHRLSLTPPAF